jgi:hypothetical protein
MSESWLLRVAILAVVLALDQLLVIEADLVEPQP